jgi:hypothetical protein
MINKAVSYICLFPLTVINFFFVVQNLNELFDRSSDLNNIIAINVYVN